MIRFLKDPANAVTAAGLVCCGVALALAVHGKFEFAVAVGLWAIVADDVDGAIARSSRDRDASTKAIGKSLDGFADIMFGSVLPAIVICASVQNVGWSLALGAVFILVGALRLSYFDYYGLTADGLSTGLPLSYDLPILGIVLLFSHVFPYIPIDTVLISVFLPLCILHISPFRIKASGPLVHFVTIATALVCSGLLIWVSTIP